MSISIFQGKSLKLRSQGADKKYLDEGKFLGISSHSTGVCISFRLDLNTLYSDRRFE